MSKIFKITFSQLLKLGIILVLLGLIIGFMPAFILANNRSSFEMGFNYVSYIIFIAMSPLIAISCFNFLNKRNSSDYYHSIAATRNSLYFGRLLAGITWLTIITITTFISAIISYKIFAQNIAVDYLLITKLYIAIYICAILVFGAISLAMSLTTGTLYNILCSALILFGARIVSEFTIRIIVRANNSLVDYENIAGIFDRKYNMLWGLFTNTKWADNTCWKLQLNRTNAFIYTIVLAIILILLGMIAFKKRRSEIAQAQNSNSIMYVMKNSLTVIAFFMYVYIRIVNNNSRNISIIDLALGLALVILVVIIWDYAITKKIHLSSSFTSIVICLLIVGLTCCINSKIANFKPLAENIDYIEISVGEEQIGQLYYARIFANPVKTDDHDTIRFFCDNYANQACDNIWDGLNNDAEAHIYVTFVDGLNRTTVKREIHATNDTIDVLYNDTNINTAIFATLPTANTLNNEIGVAKSEQQQDEITDLYSIFKKDIEEYKPKEYIASALGRDYSNGVFFIFGDMEFITFPILQSMPASYEYSFKSSNASAYKNNYEINFLKYVEICSDDLNSYKIFTYEELEKAQGGSDFLSMLNAKYKNNESPQANKNGTLVKLVFDGYHYYWLKLDSLPEEILNIK